MRSKFSRPTMHRPNRSHLTIALATIVLAVIAALAIASPVFGIRPCTTCKKIPPMIKREINKIANGDANNVFKRNIGGASVANAREASNSDQLGAKNPSDYGAVLTGRINGLTTSDVSDTGSPSGVSTAGSPFAAYQMLSPNHDLNARDFSVQLTNPPGASGSRTFYLIVNGPKPSQVLTCGPMSGSATSCDSGAATELVPASSTLAIEDKTSFPNPPASADALFGLRLTP